MEFFDEIRPYMILVFIATFLALFFWAFSPKRKKDFDEAANLPFADEDKDETKESSADLTQKNGDQKR